MWPSKPGKVCADDFVDRVEERLFARYRTDLRQIEGAAAMLDALKEQGIPVAIATGRVHPPDG